MKKRVLSMFMALALCLTLLPTAAFAEGEDVSISSGVIGGGETGGEGGGIYVAPGSPTEGGGGTYISGEDTRTEIWCTMKPSSIQRGYDGTTDGGKISIDLGFTDGTNTFDLKEGTGFTAKKTFDSADAGWHTVTVEIKLIGDAAAKYKLKEGEETFTIDGYINKAYPDLTVTLSKTACTAGEKILPLLSVEGAPKDAEVTYYYLAAELKDWAGSSDAEGGTSMPAIDGNTAISEPGTYYVYAKSGKTKNYEEDRSATVELTVTEPAAASVTKADGTVSGTYKTLPAALDAAQDGDTVKLLADHTTNWSDVEAGEYATLAVVRKTLTLDLNGMTVDYLTVGDVVPDEAGGIIDSYDGNLTVADNAQGGSHGEIKDLEFVKGSLAIQGGRIGSRLTCNENSGSVAISGGTVLGLTVGEGADVTVNGGSAHAGTWSNDGTLNITGGTFGNVRFLNNGGTIAISGGTFGTITNTNGSGPIPLMPLLADNYAFYQGDNAQNSTETTLTNVTVRPHTHSFENGKCDCGVAAIVVDNNNSCYNTLQAALGAAADDASITSVTLGQDLTEDIMFSGSAAGSLTLNMNGHKLETEAGVPLIVTGGTLRIEGAGEINQNTASNANAFPAIALTGGKLVIAGDLAAQGGYDSSSGRKPAIRAEEGELDLQGNVSLNGGLTMLGNAKLTDLLTKGTFYAQDPNGNATADNVLAVCVQQEDVASDNYNTVLKLIADGYAIYKADGTVRNAAAITLKSDTYSIGAHTCNYTQDEAHGIAYCNCGRSHAHRDLSEEKSVLVNGVCPICGYHCPHTNIGDDGVCKDCNAKMVAKVTVGETTTYTADLADALNKAANGTTITLLADTETSAYVNIYDETATGADQMVVTLDLAGHTVTSGNPIVIGADRNGAASHYGTLKIVGTGNITLDYVNLDTREKGVLDLTDWTGESISSVTVTRIGNTNEGKLIVGKDAGHIGRLAFAFVNCPSAEITNTKLHGGSYGEITTIGSGTPSLAGLLPNGCVFKKEDGSFADATASNLFNVTVSACDHGGAEGFDKNAATCPYCNAPAVAETALNNGEGGMLWRRFANLQTAIDADRGGGAEFTLLSDVTGDYTINGTQNTGLDLNGHSINGTVTVKGTKGDFITTTLNNTQNSTTASIDKVVAYDGAELCGSGEPAVIGTLTLAEGATWKTILNEKALGYKVLNADGTHKWYAQDGVSGSQLNNVIINRLPITSKTLSFKVNGTNVKGNKAERGTIVQLCASCNTSGADVSIYIGETVGNSLPIYRQKKAEYKQIGTSWYYVVDLDANTIGTYDIYFTASKDGYKVTSSHKTLKVTKPDLRNAVITFRSSNESTYEPYRTTTTAPGFTVTHNGKTLKLGVDYTASGTASSAGVSTQTLTIKAVEGSDYTGSKTAKWRIVPHKAKVEVGDVIKAYDGTTDLPDGKISLVSAAGSAGYQAGLPLPLSKGNGFELTDAKYDSANASETEKNISFTVKLTDTNYTFEDGTTEKAFTLKGSETDKTFKIDKATIDPSLNRFEQTVFNDLAKTYEIDLKQFLDTILPEGGEYGDIKYGRPSVFMDSAYYPVGGATIGNGKLSLSINEAASIKQGEEIGTVTVQVETTNYQPFTLTIHVIAKNKIVPVMAEGNTVSATDITYGQALADSKLTVNGTMQDPNTGNAVNGTFAWTDGTIKPDAGSYDAEWTFTPAAGYEEYAAVTGTVTVKVKPAKLTTVSVKASRMYYTGEAQIASIIASGQSVDSTPVTFTYSDKVDGNYTSGGPTFTDAGTYTVYYKAEAANHEPATGTFTVTIAPLPISLLSVSSISKTYDGSADVTLTADKLTFLSKTAKIKLPNTALSFSNAQFTKQQADGSYLPSPEVGGGKALSFTMTLTSNNYVFEGKSEGTTEVSDVFATDDVNRFTITKAAAPTNIPTGTLNIINGTYQTYTYDFAQLLPELSEGEYGTVSYGNRAAISVVPQSGYYYDETIVEFKNGKLTLAQFYAKDGTMTGQIGTAKVTVTTTNYENFQLTLVLNAVNQIKPTPDGTISASEITYGQALSDSAITGKMKDPNTSAEVKGTFSWQQPGNTILDASTLGHSVEWKFTPDAPEYAAVTGKVTVKVSTAPIIEASVSEPSYTYDGNSHMPSNITVKLTDGTTLVENTDYTVSAEAKTDAGTYEMKIIGIGNYHGGDSKTYHWRITPRTVNVPTVMAEDGVYNGGEAVTPTVTVKDGETVIPASEYEVTYSNNTNAGTATVTVKDVEGGNYVLSETSKTFEITKAAGGSLGTVELTQKYTDTSEHTYTPDWSELPTGQTWSYNSEYSVSTGSTATPTKQDFAADGSLLTYAISGGKAGDTVTITLKASCNNYENFTITLTIALTKKDDQKPLTITGDTSVIYGEKLTLTTTGGSGTGAVTYRIDTANSNGEATIDPETGVLTPVRVGSVSVIAAKAGDKDYNDVTSAPFVLMVKPATPTGAPNYTKITTSGKTLKDAALTTEGSTLKPNAGQLEWVDDEGSVLPNDTVVDANKTYMWRFTPADGNYTILTGSIELYHRSSSGGSYTPSYTVSVDKTENGTITASPKSASKGDTVTITVKPDKGYELDTLKALDKNGDTVKLTEKNGKYTFVMPASKVIVKGSFAAEAPEQIFFDVPVNAYYYNAVKWAADKGITGGVSPTLFAPDQPCTRAQIVTFLWRAAGSPAPKAMSAFVDVSADAYYAKAVAWAVENGITGGTGDGKFSPDATCTRAQAVTFLYRASGSPAVSGSAAFSDVATDAYYASAVKWAEKNGITGGIGNGLFGSGDNCTRAQIVTFLYRAFNK